MNIVFGKSVSHQWINKIQIPRSALNFAIESSEKENIPFLFVAHSTRVSKASGHLSTEEIDAYKACFVYLILYHCFADEMESYNRLYELICGFLDGGDIDAGIKNCIESLIILRYFAGIPLSFERLHKRIFEDEMINGYLMGSINCTIRVSNIHTEEHNKKISEGLIGIIRTEEHNKKISEGLMGNIHTEEHNKKISEGLMGNILTEEHNKKISEGLMGNILTEEHKKKISEGLIGGKKARGEAISASLAEASNEAFNARISELKEYKKKHGTITSIDMEIAPKLYMWVRNVRSGYNQFIKNKERKVNIRGYTVITESRMQALKDVEFVFKPLDEKSENAFNASFSQLVAFKKKHGDCNVAKKDDIKLYSWMYNIRRTYQQKQQGEPTSRSLKEEWINRLNKLGFVWDTEES